MLGFLWNLWLRSLAKSIFEKASEVFKFIFAPSFLLESIRALLMSFGVPSDSLSIKVLDSLLQLIPWALIMLYGALSGQLAASQRVNGTYKRFWIFAGALYLFFVYANTLTWSTPWRLTAMSLVSLVVASSMARVTNSFFRWRYVWLFVAVISLQIIHSASVNFSWYWRLLILLISGFFVYILLQVLGLSNMANSQKQPIIEPVRLSRFPPRKIVHFWIVVTAIVVSDINYRVESVGTDMKVIAYSFVVLAAYSSLQWLESQAEAQRIIMLARRNEPPPPPSPNQQPVRPVGRLPTALPYPPPYFDDDDDFGMVEIPIQSPSAFPENRGPKTPSIFRAAARLDRVRHAIRRPPPPRIEWSDNRRMRIRYPNYNSPVVRAEEEMPDHNGPLHTESVHQDFVQAHLLATVDQFIQDEEQAAYVAYKLLRKHNAKVILRIINASKEIAAEYVWNCLDPMSDTP